MTPPLDIDGKPVECGVFYWALAPDGEVLAGDFISTTRDGLLLCSGSDCYVDLAGWQFQRAVEPTWPERGA